MVGKRVREIPLPENTVLGLVLRDSGVILPQPDDVLQAGDEMLFFAGGSTEDQVRGLVRAATKPLQHD
jgi:trk system potassium uptake protein TrkA